MTPVGFKLKISKGYLSLLKTVVSHLKIKKFTLGVTGRIRLLLRGPRTLKKTPSEAA